MLVDVRSKRTVAGQDRGGFLVLQAAYPVEAATAENVAAARPPAGAAALVEAVAHVDAGRLHLFPEDDIDHAGDRVRAVQGGPRARPRLLRLGHRHRCRQAGGDAQAEPCKSPGGTAGVALLGGMGHGRFCSPG